MALPKNLYNHASFGTERVKAAFNPVENPSIWTPFFYLQHSNY